MKTARKKQHPECPFCGFKETAIIVFGMPVYSYWGKAFEEGWAIAGGCITGDEDPEWYCPECNTAWLDKSDAVFYLDEDGDFMKKENSDQ